MCIECERVEKEEEDYMGFVAGVRTICYCNKVESFFGSGFGQWSIFRLRGGGMFRANLRA